MILWLLIGLSSGASEEVAPGDFVTTSPAYFRFAVASAVGTMRRTLTSANGER